MFYLLLVNSKDISLNYCIGYKYYFYYYGWNQGIDMNKIIMLFILIGTILIGQPRDLNFGGGPHQREQSINLKCISEQERSFVRENRIEVENILNQN